MSASRTTLFVRAAMASAAISALALGIAFLATRSRGDALVHVLAPPDEAVKVRIDEGEPVHVAEGELFTRALGSGEHRVRLEREGLPAFVQSVHVDHAGQRWVIPAGDDQCFVEVDVTRSAYGEGGEPRVERRRRARPFELSASTYLSRGDLPHTRNSDDAVILVSPIACDAIRLDDPALLAHVPHD